MARLSLLLIAASIAQVAAENWALIVAGSTGYSNYRHQADACNAVKLLKSRGIPESNIVTLLWDDIASSRSNPFPGKIFNKPTPKGVEGEDVYAACHIDYKNPDVTPELFLALIEGNEKFTPKSGKKGKQLASTSEDRVFVFFVDHGAVGIVAFPQTYLYADQLVSTLEKASAAGRFKELVFYLEACEAGSMFEKLRDDINVYATTASNADESSWGTYCSPNDLVNGKHVGSCLGDLYSVNWIEDVYQADVFKETLLEDFEYVKNATDLSHVIQFGDLSEDTEYLKAFFASTTYKPSSFRRAVGPVNPLASLEAKKLSAVDSRNVHLNYLTNLYQNAVTVEAKEEASKQLTEEIQHRNNMDTIFTNTVTAVLSESALDTINSQKVVPESFDCLRAVNQVVDNECGRYSDYSLKYVKHVVYMCEEKVARGMSQEAAAQVIGNVVAAQCQSVLRSVKPIIADA